MVLLIGQKNEQEKHLFQVRSLSLVERAYLKTKKSLNANAKGMGWKIYGVYGLRSNVPSMRIEY